MPATVRTEGPVVAVATSDELAALQQQLASLEGRVASLEGSPPPDPEPEPDPPTSPPPPSPPTGENNVDRLIAAGWDYEPLEDWFYEPLTPEVVRANLRSAGSPVSDGVCRLFLPRPLTGLDLTHAGGAVGTGSGPQRDALHGQVALAQGNQAAADERFASMRARYGTGFVYGAGTYDDFWAKLLCLDWGVFEDMDDWEAKAAALIDEAQAKKRKATGSGRPFFNPGRTGGYTDPNHASSMWAIETTMALSFYGVNQAGQSHAWAESHIDSLAVHASDGGPWNPRDMANFLNLQTGPQYGWGGTPTYSWGGYETYYVGAVLNLLAADSALGTNYARNQYVLHRWKAYCGQLTPDNNYNHDRCHGIRLFGRLTSHLDAGGYYAWLRDQDFSSNPQRGNSSWAEVHATLGPEPSPVKPPPVQGERLGGFFHWRESADADAFRVSFACRGLGHGRFEPDERVVTSFMQGLAGLTDPRLNRGAAGGGHCNSFWFGETYDDGEPRILNDANQWGRHYTVHPWNIGHTNYAEKLFSDPHYIIGDASGPVQVAGGLWEWNLPLNGRIGNNRQPGEGVIGPCNSHFLFDPAARKLVITDTLAIDPALYLAWHFSPSHIPDPSQPDNVLLITDGQDTVRVIVEPLDGGELRRRDRTGWTVNGQPGVPLNYVGRLHPVPVNVAFEPVMRQDSHKVRITMEVL